LTVNNVQQANQRDITALKYYLEEYGQQLDALTYQFNLIEQRKMETQAAIEALEMLKDEGSAEVILPLGGGASVKVEVPDPGHVLVNIGADVIVRKPNEAAVDHLKGSITELEALGKKMSESIGQVRARVNEVTRQIESEYSQQMMR